MVQVLSTYLLDSNGYVMNFGSKGISGRLLLYFTRQTRSDLQGTIMQMFTHINIKQEEQALSKLTFYSGITGTVTEYPHMNRF